MFRSLVLLAFVALAGILCCQAVKLANFKPKPEALQPQTADARLKSNLASRLIAELTEIEQLDGVSPKTPSLLQSHASSQSQSQARTLSTAFLAASATVPPAIPNPAFLAFDFTDPNDAGAQSCQLVQSANLLPAVGLVLTSSAPGSAVSPAIGKAVTDKTLMATVRLSDLSQCCGGVIGIQTVRFALIFFASLFCFCCHS